MPDKFGRMTINEFLNLPDVQDAIRRSARTGSTQLNDEMIQFANRLSPDVLPRGMNAPAFAFSAYSAIANSLFGSGGPARVQTGLLPNEQAGGREIPSDRMRRVRDEFSEFTDERLNTMLDHEDPEIRSAAIEVARERGLIRGDSVFGDEPFQRRREQRQAAAVQTQPDVVSFQDFLRKFKSGNIGFNEMLERMKAMGISNVVAERFLNAVRSDIPDIEDVSTDTERPINGLSSEEALLEEGKAAANYRRYLADVSDDEIRQLANDLPDSFEARAAIIVEAQQRNIPVTAYTGEPRPVDDSVPPISATSLAGLTEDELKNLLASEFSEESQQARDELTRRSVVPEGKATRRTIPSTGNPELDALLNELEDLRFQIQEEIDQQKLALEQAKTDKSAEDERRLLIEEERAEQKRAQEEYVRSLSSTVRGTLGGTLFQSKAGDIFGNEGIEVGPGIAELLKGRTLDQPGSLLSAVGLRPPSAQALRNMTPLELGEFSEIGRLSGIPSDVFSQEITSAVPGGLQNTGRFGKTTRPLRLF
jgi:hypothetical protein